MKLEYYKFFKKYLWQINISLYILCILLLILFAKVNVSTKILIPIMVVMIITPLIFKSFWVQVFYFLCYLLFLGYLLVACF